MDGAVIKGPHPAIHEPRAFAPWAEEARVIHNPAHPFGALYGFFIVNGIEGAVYSPRNLPGWKHHEFCAGAFCPYPRRAWWGPRMLAMREEPRRDHH